MLSKSFIHKIVAWCVFMSGLLMPLPPNISNAEFNNNAQHSAAATEITTHGAQQPEAVTLTIAPANPTVTIGGSSTLYVMVNNVSDLGAFEFTLSYLPSVVTVTNVAVGPFLASTGRSPFPAARSFDNTTGKVRVGIASLGSAAGAVGSGVVMSITFMGVSAATSSPLTFSAAQVTNVAGATIASTAQNSSITVQVGSATATVVPATATSIVATATRVPATATPVPATATTIAGAATATPVVATATPIPTAILQPTASNTPSPTGTTPLPPELTLSFDPDGPIGPNGLFGSILLAQLEIANKNNDVIKDMIVQMTVPDFVLVDSSSIEPVGGTIGNILSEVKMGDHDSSLNAPTARAVTWRVSQLSIGGKFVGKFKVVVTSGYNSNQPISLTASVSGKLAGNQQIISATSRASITTCSFTRCSYLPLAFQR